MSDPFKSETAGCVYKKGIVAQSKPGFARVRFDDLDGMMTDWLPTTHANTQNNKDVEALDVGAQVSCLLDARMEDGCILGAHYSEVDAVPVSSNDKWHKRFADGTTLEYDRSTHSLQVNVVGTIVVKAAESIMLDTPTTTCTGTFTAQGLITGKSGIAASGGLMTHNGTNVGATHIHGGVQRGGGSTDGAQ